ncbi:MAG: hypothetical protein KGZ58_10510, partial [Ignavibacteriales bacterium]|nr:hypothetical protein [Ignavibacteriales bacterium]
MKQKKVKGALHLKRNPPRYHYERIDVSVQSYFVMDFEDTQFPPDGWRVANPDDDYTWERTTRASGFGSGTASAFMYFFDYNTTEETDSIFTPTLTGLQAGDSIKFNVAYGYYQDSYDSLFVSVSTNGGSSFSRVYRKGGLTLRTTNSQDDFTPTAAQWRTESIGLPSTVAGNNVVVCFVGYNDFGNNLYVDNIRIGKQPPYDIAVNSVRLFNEPFLQNVPIAIEAKLFWLGTASLPTSVIVTYKEGVSPQTQNDGISQTFFPAWSGNPVSATITFSTPYTPTTVGDKKMFVRSFLAGDSASYNDVAYKNFTVTTRITTYPYYESFEGSVSTWSTGAVSGNNSWIRGTPNKEQITSAHSGIKCWVTDTSLFYNNLENSYILSPLFDFSNLPSTPILSFFHNYQIEGGFDGGIVEFTLNGTNYQPLGTLFDPSAVHWYDIEDSLFNIQHPNFGGSSADYDDNDSGWIHSSILLSELEGASDVRFRFRLGADDDANEEGWAIDDIRVTFSSSISGTMFNDINANGEFDQSETGIPDWKIYRVGPELLENIEYVLDSTYTDSLGNYRFENLLPGNVFLVQEEQNGWQQTSPPPNEDDERVHVIRIYGNDSLVGKNFGNVHLGKISGVSFYDADADGVKDSNEAGLEGWEITLGGDINETAMTDSAGNFLFENIPEGTYSVEQIIEDGWVLTVPESSRYAFTLTAGQSSENLLFGNIEASSISGMKWNDLNGNGELDSNESGIEDWKIIISGPISDTLETDINGEFTFSGLVPGTYTVREVLQPGWIQSFPGGNGAHTITVTSGVDTSDFLFGNYQLATISGFIREDKNQNGVFDSLDVTYLQGFRVVLSGTHDDTVISRADGRYVFIGLSSGNYHVTPIVPEGWQNTYPANGSYEISLNEGQHSVGNTFGMYGYGKISGRKIHDKNANGNFDTGEPTLSNWKFYLEKESVVVDSSVTDSSGLYSFSHLNAGTYIVTEEMNDNWIQSFPMSGNYSVQVLSRTNAVNKNFGNFRFGSVSGQVFHDIDGDSVKDESEPSLMNWKIRISFGTRTDSLLTDADGNYFLGGLAPGQLTISAEISSGWIAIYPPSGVYVITISSGDSITGKNFANAQPGKITGSIFNDVNENGERDSGDIGMGQWVIRLSGRMIRTAITNSNGIYEIANLPPGNYSIREDVQSGWLQTFPSSPWTYAIALLSSGIDSGVDFGNFKYGKIFGKKFHDINGNGIQDMNESSLPNWRIRLNGARTDSALTANDGSYSFESLRFGEYVVSEQMQNGWEQTFPP